MKIKYFNSTDSCYSNVYEYDYPNKLELVSIFPEGRDIITHKIKELERAKGILSAILSVLKDNTFAYWKAYILNQSNLKETTRLRKTLSLYVSTRHARDTENFQKLIEKAKQVPISDLYPFEKMREIRGRYSACCPLHNDHKPSFYIYPNNNFYCFVCAVGGDSIKFVQETKHLNFKDAVKELAGAL